MKKASSIKTFLPRIPAVPTDGGAGVLSRVWFYVRRHVPAVTSGIKVSYFRPQRSLKDGIPIRLKTFISDSGYSSAPVAGQITILLDR